MTTRLAINGFGRIGRNVVRALLERQALNNGTDAAIEVVAVNDLGDPEMLAHLLRFDTVHGALQQNVELADGALVLGNQRIAMLNEREPGALPWSDLGVDVVIESTGRFTSRADAGAHIEAGAKRVAISAPSGDSDATFVIGVNDHLFDPAEHTIVSNASCTTNCLAPMVKVLDDSFGVESAMMTTVHAYTGDQSIVDGPHKDFRRARSAAANVIPTSTGAAKAIGLVLPHLAGKLDGMAMRVPIPNGSITDLVATLRTETTAQQINDAFAAAAESGPLSKVLSYSDAPLVSSDIVGSPASCTFDAGLTMTMGASAKIAGWYDNEWGYSSRLIDLVALMSQPSTSAA